jgi:hypothetical protein
LSAPWPRAHATKLRAYAVLEDVGATAIGQLQSLAQQIARLLGASLGELSLSEVGQGIGVLQPGRGGRKHLAGLLSQHVSFGAVSQTGGHPERDPERTRRGKPSRQRELFEHQVSGLFALAKLP